MRVLVVHNRYSSRVPSGENLAVDDEVRWLREAGVEVHRHEVTNDDMIDPGPLARARDGVESVLSLRARQRFEAELDVLEPDLVHVHNLFPLLTSSVPMAARRRAVPVVWTVHNFRTRCVAGTRFRDGRPCHACRPGWRMPGIVHRCYAESLAASALVTASTSLYRSWARRVGVTPIAISHEMKRWAVEEAGFPEARTQVKYNGVAAPPITSDAPPPSAQQGFLFIGRLSHEKGVDLLLDAWRHADTSAELRFIGAGDQLAAVQRASRNDSRIVVVGQVDTTDVSTHVTQARAAVVPSVWDEPFGRVAAEALACGRPVVTTGRGALAEIVDDSCGWTTGLDPLTLRQAIEAASKDDEAVDERGRAGRRRYEATFAPDATTSALIAIYEDVLASAGRSA